MVFSKLWTDQKRGMGHAAPANMPPFPKCHPLLSSDLPLDEVIRLHPGANHRDAAKRLGHVHVANPGLWKKLFFFVCIPAIGLSMVNTYLAEMEHKKHPHRPEFRPYEYMRIRNKKFPWGDGNHTLFHNPKHNALPDGYEEDL